MRRLKRDLLKIGVTVLFVLQCSHQTIELKDTETYQTDYDQTRGDFVTAVSAHIHPEVETVLVVRWTQVRETPGVSLRYSFENDEWFETPVKPGLAADHEEVLLGIPEKTAVAFYFQQDPDSESLSDGGPPDAGASPIHYFATTGDIPAAMPRPTVLSFDADAAGKERWLLGSVENTPSQDGYYIGPFWIYIIDREGRIVWYYSDRGDNPCMAYPRAARDGSHLYIEKRMFYNAAGYTPKVLRLTLDYRQAVEISVPGLDDCIDVTDDGSLLYNTWSRGGDAGLYERRADGSTRKIWDCAAWAFASGVTAASANYCYSNTVNWNALNDSVTMSFPYINTAVEIDRQTGALLGQWGDAPGSCSFVPETWSFEFNHFAGITPDDTLLISTHAPGHGATEDPGEHRFVEFEIDRENCRLVEKWSFGEGIGDWPMFKGEAHRTASGNTLVNYGTGGGIREVTPAGETVWHVKWDADFEDDRFNKMVGHNFLLDDLYPLCRGFKE